MARATTAVSGDRSPATGSSARPSSPTGPRSASARSSRSAGKARRRRRRASKLFRFDRELGSRFVAGADEAGRGSLAGPLVAAAVLIDLESLGVAERRALGDLDDSKRRSAEERQALLGPVLAAATRVGVAVRSVAAIDAHGVHRANLEALGAALEAVACPGATCVVDGFSLPDCRVDHSAVVDGDARSAVIAAASVVAKVTRDRYMSAVAPDHPAYGFEANAGYSTSEHREAIIAHGPCRLHRLSFQSIAYTQLELA